MAPTSTYLRWVALLLILLFGYIMEGIAQVARQAWTHLPVWPVVVFLIAVLGPIPLLMHATRSTMTRSFDEELL